MLRREEYEQLFYNQQASIDPNFAVASGLPFMDEPVAEPAPSPATKTTTTSPKQPSTSSKAASISKSQQKKELDERILNIAVGTKVIHTKFGPGTVRSVNKLQKYIHIDFDGQVSKRLLFPDSFSNGFLSLGGDD